MKNHFFVESNQAGHVDPYCHLENGTTSQDTNKFSSVDWYEWPEITYAYIYNFFINITSYCMHEQLKAYKSLDGYNYFLMAG